MKKRIDDILVLQKLAPSLDAARRMVMAGEIFVNAQRVQNASQIFATDIEIELRRDRFVSRGGLKLEGALIHFALESQMRGANVLDVGASTGGFTDCALQFGARHVTAIDVGHGHLHWKLRNDERVTYLERMNVTEFCSQVKEPFDFVVADISFNSVTRLLADILRCSCDEKTRFLILIKPQFELPSQLVKSGIVEDEVLQQQALDKVESELVSAGGELRGMKPSVIKGRKGNQEYFCYFRIANIAQAQNYVTQKRVAKL